VNHLAETIQIVVLGKRRGELDELVFIHENFSFSREESVARLLALDGEREGRVVRPGHSQLRPSVFAHGAFIWPGDEFCWEKEPRLILRADIAGQDLDRDAIVEVISDRHVEMLDVIAVDVAWWTGEIQICSEPGVRVADVGCFITWTNRLGVDGFRVFDVGQDILAHVGGGR
jgi:hypothetical protein